MSAANMTTTTRRRRPAMEGEAHYRDLMLQLQGEFVRVVAALEARATALAQHNDELQHENEELRSDNVELQRRMESQEEQLRAQQEQMQMQREESEARWRETEVKWRAACEQIEEEQKQWTKQREMRDAELQRVSLQLSEASTRLGEEQKRSAHMSQEVELLLCRVDAAVTTSRSFEQRLQQLRQLKRDEKADMEQQIAHLTKRLEQKKEQNRYLAEALMEKDASRAARHQQRERDLKTKTGPAESSPHTSSSSYSSVNSSSSFTERRRSPPTPLTPAPITTTNAKDISHRRHLFEYEEKRVAAMEDAHSHAPTSPTASSVLSPAASTATSVHTRRVMSPTTPPPSQKATTSTRHGGRLQRELEALRRTFDLPQELLNH